jgi:hypothetical protein
MTLAHEVTDPPEPAQTEVPEPVVPVEVPEPAVEDTPERAVENGLTPRMGSVSSHSGRVVPLPARR